MVRVEVRLLGVIKSFAEEVQRQQMSVTNLRNVDEQERKVARSITELRQGTLNQEPQESQCEDGGSNGGHTEIKVIQETDTIKL